MTAAVAGGGGDGHSPLISVHPDDLKFIFDVEKQSFCDLEVVNNTEHQVAFKVKTTSPKKYFVRPNTGVIQPRGSSLVRVILQAQRQAPPDMQCRDKFLLQSTIVPSHINVDDLPPDTFNKDVGGKKIEERKLRVFYTASSAKVNSDALRDSSQSPESVSGLQRLEDERDAAVKQTQKLQLELDMMKRRRYRKSDPGFSLTFAFVVGLIGIAVGFFLNLSLSSPSAK